LQYVGADRGLEFDIALRPWPYAVGPFFRRKEKPMKVLVVFYSMYGHVYKMAQAVAEGVREVPGAEALLRRVPETLSEEVLGKMGALEAQKAMAGVPVCTVEELGSADAVIFGTPTRLGNMCGQMR